MKQKISFKRGAADAPAIISLAVRFEVEPDSVPEVMADIGQLLAKHLTGDQAAEFLTNLRSAKAEYEAEAPSDLAVSCSLDGFEDL